MYYFVPRNYYVIVQLGKRAVSTNTPTTTKKKHSNEINDRCVEFISGVFLPITVVLRQLFGVSHEITMFGKYLFQLRTTARYQYISLFRSAKHFQLPFGRVIKFIAHSIGCGGTQNTHTLQKHRRGHTKSIARRQSINDRIMVFHQSARCSRRQTSRALCVLCHTHIKCALVSV